AVSPWAATSNPGPTLRRVPPGSPRRWGPWLPGVAIVVWALVCPRFHQYPFESADVLAETLVCLPHADVIVVSLMATPVPDAPAWSRFIEQVERTLAEGYSCQPWNGERICTRA